MASAVDTENGNSAVTESVQQDQAGDNDGKSALRVLLGDDYNKLCNNDSESEASNYFREQIPSLDTSPLVWWKANPPDFPDCLGWQKVIYVYREHPSHQNASFQQLG